MTTIDGRRGAEFILTCDTASTTHLTGNRQMADRFVNSRVVQEVCLMNKFACRIIRRGDLTVVCNGVVVTLRNMAYVPASGYTLVSAAKLLEDEGDGSSMKFRKDEVEIKLEGKRVIEGVKVDGLYKVQAVPARKKDKNAPRLTPTTPARTALRRRRTRRSRRWGTRCRKLFVFKSPMATSPRPS